MVPVHGKGHGVPFAQLHFGLAGRGEKNIAITTPRSDRAIACVRDAAAVHRAGVDHPGTLTELLRLAEGLFVRRYLSQPSRAVVTDSLENAHSVMLATPYNKNSDGTCYGNAYR